MGKAPVFLLIEPSLSLRSSLHAWLESVLIDPHILTAANGVEALGLAAQEQPTHVLIEMQLPDNRALRFSGKCAKSCQLPKSLQQDGMKVASFSKGF